MNYDELKTDLLTIFNTKNQFITTYNKSIKNNDRNLLNSINHVVNPNINLSVNFPGYKTKVRQNRIIYDYRVDLNGIAISHVNLIVDLYNKATQAPNLIRELYNFLIDIGVNCLNVNLQNYNNLATYQFNPPPTQLLTRVNNCHRNLGKWFNINANLRNYSLDELLSTIGYIVLQEDINYPISKGFNGRKMCFSRYIEALLVAQAQNPNPQVYSLESLIERTLSHTRTQPWDNFDNLYAPILNFI